MAPKDTLGYANLDALMRARGQSVRELISDADRYTRPKTLAAFNEQDPPRMSWESAVEVLCKLDPIETTQQLYEEGLPFKVARIATNSATFLYAVSFDIMEDCHNLALMNAVHCFEHEPFDLARETHFAIMDFPGEAGILHAPDLVDALENQKGVKSLLFVYAVELLEGNPAPDEA